MVSRASYAPREPEPARKRPGMSGLRKLAVKPNRELWEFDPPEPEGPAEICRQPSPFASEFRIFGRPPLERSRVRELPWWTEFAAGAREGGGGGGLYQ